MQAIGQFIAHLFIANDQLLSQFIAGLPLHQREQFAGFHGKRNGQLLGRVKLRPKPVIAMTNHARGQLCEGGRVHASLRVKGSGRLNLGVSMRPISMPPATGWCFAGRRSA